MEERLCSLMEELMGCLDMAVARDGLINVNCDAMGKVVDMIKDLAQAKKYIAEAKYYDKATGSKRTEAMVSAIE